jgi:hypothetical protein
MEELFSEKSTTGSEINEIHEPDVISGETGFQSGEDL